MTCNTPTASPNRSTHPTANQSDANPSTAANGSPPPPTAASPTTSGSATIAAAPTSSALGGMMAQAAQLARRPAPTANLLYSSLDWHAARPLASPTPLVVQLWIGQSAKLIQQYQDLLAVLVEMQVATIDRSSQANAQPHPEE